MRTTNDGDGERSWNGSMLMGSKPKAPIDGISRKMLIPATVVFGTSFSVSIFETEVVLVDLAG